MLVNYAFAGDSLDIESPFDFGERMGNDQLLEEERYHDRQFFLTRRYPGRAEGPQQGIADKIAVTPGIIRANLIVPGKKRHQCPGRVFEDGKWIRTHSLVMEQRASVAGTPAGLHRGFDEPETGQSQEKRLRALRNHAQVGLRDPPATGAPQGLLPGPKNEVRHHPRIIHYLQQVLRRHPACGFRWCEEPPYPSGAGRIARSV